MKILHIANDYFGSKVHRTLDEAMIKLEPDFCFTTYSALKQKSAHIISESSLLMCNDRIDVKHSSLLKPIHKLLYKTKISKIFNDVEGQIKELDSYSAILASTLCADGGVAYELYKKYDIPYIVCVRNTDINSYFKYMKFYKSYFYEILNNASKIIFISETVKNNFIKDSIPKSISLGIKNKSTVIFNGVNPIFLNNRKFKINKKDDPIKILYYGGIIKLKNLVRVISAIRNLRGKGYNLEFTIIGKNWFRFSEANYSKKIQKLADEFTWITILDKMNTTELVAEVNKHDLFVMVSHKETFGLVYVEALSQGLPIIYTKGQGFDGVFNDGVVGYSANDMSVSDIEDKIVSILSNYPTLTQNISQLTLNEFRWEAVAQTYCKIIKSLT